MKHGEIENLKPKSSSDKQLISSEHRECLPSLRQPYELVLAKHSTAGKEKLIMQKNPNTK